MNSCINDLINEISTDNMMKTLKVFSKLHRYSGSEHGETSARYILDKLHEYGVEAELERYELYRSLPTGGTLSLCAAPASYFEIMPAVFSLPVENRRFELVYVCEFDNRCGVRVRRSAHQVPVPVQSQGHKS